MRMWTVISLSLLAACGDKDDVGIEPDTQETDDTGPSIECLDDDDCNDWEICEADSCEDGDRNNSTDDALELSWDNGPSRDYRINPAGDVDYYELNAAGGEFVRIRTITPEDTDTELYDTIITVRDPNLKILAQVDNYPTGATLSSSDTTVYAYLPIAGRYLIEVEDHGALSDTDKIELYGDSDYTYTIQVDSWSAGTSETDAVDDPSLSYGFTGDDANSYWPLGVVLEEDGDVDYIDFDFPYGQARFILYAQDDTFNDAVPLVRIYNDAEQLITTLDGVTDGRDQYTPALSAGSYRLEVTDSDGEGGEDRWFFLFMNYGPEGSTEPQEIEPNDSWNQATELETVLNNNSSGNYTFSSGMGYADDVKGKADEDWYAITAFDDGFLVTCMMSSYFGSTALPSVAIIDGDGETVLDEAEGADGYPTAAVENVEVSAGQTYYIRFTHTSGDTGLPAWYEFNTYIADFSIGNYGCPP